MNNTEKLNKLHEAMINFSTAYNDLVYAIDMHERETGTSVNDLPNFTESYPFDKSFDELAVAEWVRDVVEYKPRPTFKVFDYQYLNTGGNTMVGIHRVWLPEEKKVVYVYTNEEGSTISTVDYIRDELEIDDYDEFIVGYVDWGRITGHEKYFELYRYCYNQYLVDDCKYFGITRGVQYHLLSDELQEMISDAYLKYLAAYCGMMVETDGKQIVTDPDYEAPEVDEVLQSVKDWLRWHDDIPTDDDLLGDMYNEYYRLTLAGKTVRIPFYAETFNLVNDLLKGTIEDW